MHCAAALPLLPAGRHLRDGRRRHPYGDRGCPRAWRRAVHPRLVDGGVWHSRRSSLPRGRIALRAVGPYGEAKVQAEEICLGYRRQGMCVPILRPKTFVGPERLGVFALFYEWASEGRGFPMIGSGNNRLPVSRRRGSLRRDISRATIDPLLANDTFNIGAKVFTTMKEDYQAVLDDAGFAKRMHGFPATPDDLDVAGSGSTAAVPSCTGGSTRRRATTSASPSRRPSGSSVTRRSTPIGTHCCATTAGILRTANASRASPASHTARRGSRACWPWPSGSSDARHPAQRSGVDRGARAGRRQERRAFP